MGYSAHCALCTVHCDCALFTVHCDCTLCTVHRDCALCTVTVHCTLCTVTVHCDCTLCTVHRTIQCNIPVPGQVYETGHIVNTRESSHIFPGTAFSTLHCSVEWWVLQCRSNNSQCVYSAVHCQ